MLLRAKAVRGYDRVWYGPGKKTMGNPEGKWIPVPQGKWIPVPLSVNGYNYWTIPVEFFLYWCEDNTQSWVTYWVTYYDRVNVQGKFNDDVEIVDDPAIEVLINL